MANKFFFRLTKTKRIHHQQNYTLRNTEGSQSFRPKENDARGKYIPHEGKNNTGNGKS